MNRKSMSRIISLIVFVTLYPLISAQNIFNQKQNGKEIYFFKYNIDIQ